MKKTSLQNLCYISIFVAVMAVMAQISIPMPLGVPMTMQTFAVALTGAVLDAKKSSVAVFIYILLGAVGAPIFTGGNGGFSVIAGPTGGYILSFPLFAFVVGLGADKGSKMWLAAGLIVGCAINLSSGMLWLSVVTQRTVQEAFFAAVLPFVPVELIKLAMVFAIGPRLKKAVRY